ncbi:hypothetical protein [Actinophytocola sediminis]
MTRDRLLHDDADELRALPGRIRSARLTPAEWRGISAALAALTTALRTGSNREVVRAAGVFDDLVGVRVSAQPGGLATDGPPDEVTHLVHEVELAVTRRLTDTPDDPADDQ